MRRFIFGVCILFFSTSLKAQDYTPLLDTVNEWQFTTCYFGCITDYYFTDGDTIVEGKNYKILDGYHFIERNLLLREEIENRKVFLNIVQESGNEEYLMYDYSLEVGDEINLYNPISPFPENAGIFKVDSIILRELVDTNLYKHFYLSPIKTNTTSTENTTWIEGVGSLSIINAAGGHPDINGVGALSCFFKNEELFYSNLDSIDACSPNILSVENNQQELNNVSLFYRNKTSFLYQASSIYKIEIFNLFGKLLHTQLNTFKEEELNIDFSEFSKGMYFLIATGFNQQKKSFKLLNY